MVTEGTTETKRRHVFFDEFTNGFYAESRVEAVHRFCNYRTKVTAVRNRSHDERYKDRVQQAETSKHLFDMKNEKAESQHHDNLRENAAYKQVLCSVAKERAKNHRDILDHMGMYGPGATRANLDILVQRQIKYMTPAAKRKRRANKLLSERKTENVFSRNINTPDLFEMVRNRKSRSVSQMGKLPSKNAATLILPPIEVHLKNRFSNVPKSINNRNDIPADGTRGGVTLPAVFVTQKGYLL